ncbi:MAG TPA: ATP-dependent helicase [Streptosporangiaceae bacterium]|nr:ATP-dependent helicase [Streptosporangiaceae bacterium]
MSVDVLAALDPEQREVALATRGPVCVLAGAGTGKTRAITHRIAYAVHTGVMDPAHVLALTFTTRAAGELRGRLRLLGDPGLGLDQVRARTFHSAALRQLRHFWPGTVGGRPPRVLAAKTSLIAEVARAHRITLGGAELPEVAGEIEWAKVTQIRPEEYEQEAAKAGRTPPLGTGVAGQLYAGYERLRRSRHLIDFESLLELTAAVLAENQQAAADVRDRFRYLVVDEYQDVNPLQKLLLDTWLGDRDELCVVGDPDQAIYSFTGASPAYLTGFTAQFPDATVIRLVRDYRSTPQVVALANRVITEPLPGLPGRPVARWAASLVAQRPPGPEPSVTGYPDDQAEAGAVAAQAASLIAAGTDPRQIAVLVRINVQTQGFERALSEAGVPYQLSGMERFFDRAEVRQALNLIRGSARTVPGEASLPAQVRHILSGLGLTGPAPANGGAARERWESLAALAALAGDLALARPGATLADFADELAVRAAAENPPAVPGVTLATLHGAKGLEWDAVFLPGLTEGVLPIVYAQTSKAIAEERRLFYVGVTRARERLALSWAGARSPGAAASRSPSRFLRAAGRGVVGAS